MGGGGFKSKAIKRTSLMVLNALVFLLPKLRRTRLAQLEPEHMRYLGELNKEVRRAGCLCKDTVSFKWF